MKRNKIFIVIGMCMTMFNLNAISIGSKAPDFSLLDQEAKMRTLGEFNGRFVVLYFYPKDNTPGCTKQACQLRNNFDDFKKQNIVVLGINYDTPKTHKIFALKHNLPFILLSDTTKAVAKKYGANNWWFLPFPYRMTFVIDPQGTICSILPNVDVAEHTTKVLHVIQQHKQKNSETK